MVKMCECCGKFTPQDAAAFCMHCGYKFPEDECVLLHQIRDSVDESQQEIRNIRILLRKSQRKPKLTKTLFYLVIAIIFIVIVVAVFVSQLGARP
jgi:uncharacterized membrane protein YvbJ